MASSITVTGTGRVSAPVDLIEMNFTLSAENTDYDALMSASAESLELLKKVLANENFKKDDIKTLSFNVNRNYTSERGDDGVYREKFVGYVSNHTLAVRYAFDSKRLAEVINAVASSGAEPRFTITFTVSDAEALKTQALKAAYNDALKNAETLAETAGMSLIELKELEYLSSSPRFASATAYSEDSMNRSLFKAAAIEMQPEDITGEELVKAVWEIG